MSVGEAQYDDAEEIYNLHSKVVNTFKSGKTKDLAWRKWQLKQLWWMIEDKEKEIMAAMKQDLNRSNMESLITDLAGARKDILTHLDKIDQWTADESIGDSFIAKKIGLAHIRREPLGVVLIIGAWNFPLLLVLQPLIAAIAAGCCVIMKPSEVSTNCMRLLKSLVSTYLDDSAIGLVCGGIAETSQLLELRFDRIFFTGSATVGRIISASAAKHLTPITLELGGLSPAIVCKSADIDLAAKSIIFSKFLNAGQICLSVNHVFVDPSVHDEFVQRMKYWCSKFLGNQSTVDAAIGSHKHFDRLTNLLRNTTGKIAYGGGGNRESRRMEPTVVLDVDMDDVLLKEEIFGPICPIIKSDFRNAYNVTNKMDHPLAMYIYSKDKKEVEEILQNTNSGGVTVNEVILHAGFPGAPFGGVGGSGHGYYHGKYGFDSFTHLRTIMVSPGWLQRSLEFRFPPFGNRKVPKGLVIKANFKRGETIEDQRRGGSFLTMNRISVATAVSFFGIIYYHYR